MTTKWANMETWKPVPGWDKLYAVSSLGRVMRIAGGRGTSANTIMSGTLANTGYMIFHLRDNRRAERKTGHSLVMEAFVGMRPDGFEVNHLDGDRANNRLENLEYCTSSANKKHSYDVLGRIRRGAAGTANSHAKLTDKYVAEIRRLYLAGGRTQQSIAHQYGITQNMVSKIVLRQAWNHLRD